MRLATKITVFLLRNQNLPLEDRLLLTGQVLNSLDAIPLTDIITVDEKQTLLVRGKPLEYEQAMKIRESARQALSSPARHLVQEAVAFKGVAMGFHKATDPLQMIFARAALWFAQQENELFEVLAGTRDQAP